jgi:hypothetical protein
MARAEAGRAGETVSGRGFPTTREGMSGGWNYFQNQRGESFRSARLRHIWM